MGAPVLGSFTVTSTITRLELEVNVTLGESVEAGGCCGWGGCCCCPAAASVKSATVPYIRIRNCPQCRAQRQAGRPVLHLSETVPQCQRDCARSGSARR